MSWLRRTGLSRRFGASVNRWVRQPIQPCSPEDEGPKGAGEALLTVCLPPTRAQRLSLGHCCCPRLVPLPITDRVA